MHIFFGSDFSICVAQNQRTFEDQGLIVEVKKYMHLSMIGWENDIGYGNNLNKARPWHGKCDSFRTVHN